jgi:hypothetical protein
VFSIYPNLEGGYHKEQILFKYQGEAIPGEENYPGQFDVKRTSTFIYLLGNYNAAATLHTLVGAFGVGIGYGVGAFWSDDEEEMAFQAAPVMNLRVDYVSFWGKDIFFFIRNDVYVATAARKRAPISNELYSVDSWSISAVGLGYFLPSMKTAARSLL